jgi:hypothetical protein
VKQVAEDPALLMLSILPSSPGWKLNQLARKLLTKEWTEPPLLNCGRMLHSAMQNASEHLNKTRLSVAGELEMLHAVSSMSLTLSADWVQSLKTVEQGFEDNTYNLLFQRVVDQYLPMLMKELKSKNEISSGVAVSKHNLTLREKQVLHYSAAYIPRKLLRRYRRSPANKAAQLFEAVVKSWVPKETVDVEDAKLCDSVTYWTHLQDRGGLLHCNAKFFQFMKILESHLCKIMNCKTLPKFDNCDIVIVVGGQLKDIPELSTAFQTLVGPHVLSEDLCQALFDQVLTCWITTKARHVTKQYCLKLREAKQGNLTKRGTPALRKTLDKV